MRRLSVLWCLAFAAAFTWSCGEPTAPAAPSPPASNAPIAGPHTGPVGIEFVGANIDPGGTISGCGPSITGCAGRLRLSFRLRSVAAGSVLNTSATLHGTTKIACLSASGPGFFFAANTTVVVDLVFDRFNAGCALPFDSTDLGVNVEGTVEVSSRQEFAVRYHFTP